MRPKSSLDALVHAGNIACLGSLLDGVAELVPVYIGKVATESLSFFAGFL